MKTVELHDCVCELQSVEACTIALEKQTNYCVSGGKT